MAFSITYYISLACPTVEKSLEMIDRYIEKGATGFQIDMPSRDPYGETDFVKKMMSDALAAHSDYAYYMDAFRRIRAKHKDLNLSIVVYKDVIDTIGIEVFTDFCKEISMYSVRLAGNDERVPYTEYMTSHGLFCIEGVGYYMPQEHIDWVMGRSCIVTLRTKRKTEAPNRGLETWSQRIGYLRDKGVQAPIYAIADMRTAEDLKAAKDGGADGTIVGNVLMQLWDDEERLWAKFQELQSVAE